MILLWLPGDQTPILLLLVILPTEAFLLELLFMLAPIHGRLDQIQILRSLYVFGTVISIGLEANLVHDLPCGEASARGSGGSNVSDRLQVVRVSRGFICKLDFDLLNDEGLRWLFILLDHSRGEERPTILLL